MKKKRKTGNKDQRREQVTLFKKKKVGDKKEDKQAERNEGIKNIQFRKRKRKGKKIAKIN